jgi:hypothetical protein
MGRIPVKIRDGFMPYCRARLPNQTLSIVPVLITMLCRVFVSQYPILCATTVLPPRVCSVSTLGVPGAKFHRLLIDVIIYHVHHSLIDYLIPGRALQ